MPAATSTLLEAGLAECPTPDTCLYSRSGFRSSPAASSHVHLDRTFVVCLFKKSEKLWHAKPTSLPYLGELRAAYKERVEGKDRGEQESGSTEDGRGQGEGETMSTYGQVDSVVANEGERNDKHANTVAGRDDSKDKGKVHLSTGPCTNGRSEARLLPILHFVRIPTPVCLTEAYYLLMAFDKDYSNFWGAMLTYMGEFVRPTGLIVPDDFEGWSRELFEIKDRFPMGELNKLKDDSTLMPPHALGE